MVGVVAGISSIVWQRPEAAPSSRIGLLPDLRRQRLEHFSCGARSSRLNSVRQAHAGRREKAGGIRLANKDAYSLFSIMHIDGRSA
jgi:hypothetical protein